MEIVERIMGKIRTVIGSGLLIISYMKEDTAIYLSHALIAKGIM